MLESTLQDVRYGLRMLAANRSFTAMAVLSLTLGIGANAAIFSLLYALLLRPLPVPNPGGLVQVKIDIAGKRVDSFSYPVIRALAERHDIFAALGGFCGNQFLVGPTTEAVRTPGAWVSGGFLPALQLAPAAGRLLTPDDDRPGAPLVAVITDAYWNRHFQRSPSAIGSTLLVEGKPVTIVGVTPAGFTGANVGEVADLTLPFQAMTQLSPDRQGLLQAGNQYIRSIARLAAGLSVEQARARLKVIWPGMVQVSVNPRTPQKRREAMLASTLELDAGSTGWTPLRNQYSKPLYILMAISGLVLLLACINVANLLLARSAARRREFAIRLAIGAGRTRIVRQLLIESLLLSSVGAALGLMLAQSGSRLLLSQVSRTLKLDVGLNLPVLAFGIAAAILTGILFGLAPALRSTAGAGGLALRTTSTSGQPRARLAWLLVTAQVALSLLLLIGAGLFTHTLHNLQTIDPGFRHEGVLMVDLDVRGAARAVPDAGARAAEMRDGLQTIAGVPGVSAAALSNFTPISGGYWSQAVQVDGQSGYEEDVVFFAVSPGFFTALSMPFKMGRDFSTRDDGSAPPVAIVNEEFVRRLLPPGRSSLGQTVSASDSRFWKNMQIIGVVGNSRPYSLREPVRPCIYVPYFQLPPDRTGFGTFEVKASGSLSAVAADLQRTLSRRYPGLPLQIRPFTVQVEDSIRREILMAQLAGFFGVLALILAAVGLYGLLAYAVAQRTSEVGIRMALGADPAAVVCMMLARGMRPVAAGIVIALPVAWWACRFVAALLYGMQPFDPGSVATAVVILTLAALAAGFVPARRAAKVDPMVALRQD